MGNIKVKPSPSITQTCQGYSNVPLSERGTPPTSSSSSQQQAPLSASTPSSQQVTNLGGSTPIPTVRHAEWDECMRQSILTIGSTTITAIAAGLMVPAADTLLLLGTGIGVLWSVKRCRTLMRDGIMSPEQAKALEQKRRMEREERKRQRKMEKEAKQKAAAEQKLVEKQENKKGTAKGKNLDTSSDECCAKLKETLQPKGARIAGTVGCEKVSHINEKTHNEGEKALTIGSQTAEDVKPHVLILQENQVIGSKNMVNCTAQKGESAKILHEAPQIVKINPQQLESSEEEKHASKTKRKMLVKRSGNDMYSTVKLFAPYSRYLSESVILTCAKKECNCTTEEESCTCHPEQISLGEPQQYILATDADEDAPSQDDRESLIFHHINTNATEVEVEEITTEVRVSAQGNSSHFRNDIPNRPASEEDQIDVNESEEYGSEVEATLPKAFDSIESLDDDIIDITVEDNEDVDIKIEESQDGFDVEVMRNDVGDDQIEQLRNEVEVVFAETFKSESWPFSFTLPSLDKFSKKKNNSFKWPPLTSSIIVKPKREPTCNCSDGSGPPKDEGEAQKHCTCGSPKHDCNGP